MTKLIPFSTFTVQVDGYCSEGEKMYAHTVHSVLEADKLKRDIFVSA
jgi:hypothetical protein